ncbi:proton-coupled folate transporter-like [Toxorhynchites rutilus septentrionalis]|uniref:proton-coupled folate transporter-like n=1 Tax=Toxorhynchites rutilus septentrionalis TaxID=329112 RepID=UPI00247884A6|nr:proton-coupled folate transporter-like [Toxorhynchites rutilus septentrionalis]
MCSNSPTSLEERSLIEGLHPNSMEQYRTSPPRRRRVLLEPPVFLMFYAWNVSAAVFTDQIVYQACTVSLGINKSECALLGKEHESPEVQSLEARVQPYSADILMVEAVMDSMLPAVLNLFIGPWSDRFGRKPVMIVSFVGCMVSYVIITTLCYLSDQLQLQLDPWLYAIAFVPTALSGGYCTLMTIVYCYIADVTCEQERGTKMTILEASMFVGILLGNISSSFILRMTNSTTVFAIATLSVFLAVLYIVVEVRESIPTNEHQHDGFYEKFRYLLRPRLVIDTLNSSFSGRPHFDRAIILMGTVALGGSMFAIEDTYTVFFLFLRKQFNWAVRKYSFYSSAETICMILGNLVGTYGLLNLAGMTEAGIAAIGFFSCLLKSIAIAVAYESWHLYLAIFVCMLSGSAGPMIRASISNSIPPDDIGKIYSFASTFEALMQLGAAPLYTFVYKNTLSWYPGAFSWISAGVYAACYCLTMSICILQSIQRPIYTAVA